MKTFPAVVLAAALSYVTFVRAELKMTDVAAECADSAGFNTCWSNALSEAQTCYTHNCQGEGTCNSENDCTASNPNCVQACSCVAYAAMIQCSLQSCWNMVRSCEYQNLAISAAMNCPIALGSAASNPFNGDSNGWIYIPYFPSNSTLPGSCSCNLAYTYLIQRAALNSHTECINKCDSSSSMVKCGNTCDCCLGSDRVSAFYDNCPSTDPAAAAADMPQFDLAAFEQATTCNSILAQANCPSLGFTYGFSLGEKLYAPDNVPSNGSSALSNVGGSITSPPYPTLTWALGAVAGGISLQTAVAVTTGVPAASGSGSGSGSESGSTSKSASAAGTSSTGAARHNIPNDSISLVGILILALGLVY